MRLTSIRNFLDSRHISYNYAEENESGSIDFIHKGLSYHIWEYPAPERGAESNIRTAGRSEDFEGDYEEKILDILRTWPL